jgi:hypothetical protein
VSEKKQLLTARRLKRKAKEREKALRRVLVNGILWFGNQVGLQNHTYQKIYLGYPISTLSL